MGPVTTQLLINGVLDVIWPLLGPETLDMLAYV